MINWKPFKARSDVSKPRPARLAGLLGAAAVSAMAALTSAATAETSVLRMSVPNEMVNMDPAYFSDGTGIYMFDNLFPKLAKPVAGEEWVFELDAAKSIDTSDPLNIKFELKPGIMWSGGYGELTAEDVQYSIMRNFNPELESPMVVELSAIEDVEVTGKYTGVIKLKEESAPLLKSALYWFAGTIISKAATEEAGGFVPIDTKATAGPYRIKEVDASNRIILEKDPNWTGEQAYYDEFVLVPVADDNVAQIAFEAGELDFVYTTADSTEVLEAKYGDAAKTGVRDSLDFLWLGMNTEHPNLQDERIRQAIQLGIDKEAIVQGIYQGKSDVAATLAAKGALGYSADGVIPRDVEKARALLEEAGAVGSTIKLTYEGNYTERTTAAQLIQANLAEIGLNVTLEPLEEGTFWAIGAFDTMEREMTLKVWFGGVDMMYALRYFTPDQVDIWNWEHFRSDEFVSLIDAANAEADDAARGDIYNKMQNLMIEAGAAAPITHPPVAYLHRSDIVPGLRPDGRPVFHAFKPTE